MEPTNLCKVLGGTCVRCSVEPTNLCKVLNEPVQPVQSVCPRKHLEAEVATFKSVNDNFTFQLGMYILGGKMLIRLPIGMVSHCNRLNTSLIIST